MRQRSPGTLALALAGALVASACGDRKAAPAAPSATAPAPATASSGFEAGESPANLPKGLLLALSQFEVGPDGKVLPKPGPARAEIYLREDGQWKQQVLEDPASNVFHKVLVYAPPGAAPGLVTLGGNAAAVKLWRKGPAGFTSETLWETSFGGKQNRMRDAEIGDLYGDGKPDLAVATHDQGVVATVRPKEGGGFTATELDREKDTFVHEIELGDLDGDGVLEVYATPSEPNRLDGSPQAGKVVRYVPAKGEGRTVVADLGSRHAKEILVGDVDGDGRDELYVSVEAETEGEGATLRIKTPVEIRRYDAGTDPAKGVVIATIDDRLSRVLTAGDVDGDGKKEIVAATFRSGLWLLRPGTDPKGPWKVESIDRNSSGFEHAALLTDLDGDGRDELYVASDDQGELRRYVWTPKGVTREVIATRPVKASAFVWNITPVPAELVR
jgi:hypothetical protein